MMSPAPTSSFDGGSDKVEVVQGPSYKVEVPGGGAKWDKEMKEVLVKHRKALGEEIGSHDGALREMLVREWKRAVEEYSKGAETEGMRHPEEGVGPEPLKVTVRWRWYVSRED